MTYRLKSSKYYDLQVLANSEDPDQTAPRRSENPGQTSKNPEQTCEDPEQTVTNLLSRAAWRPGKMYLG